MKKLALILVAILAASSVMAQTTKILGRVMDAATGEGVPYAAVFFEGTTIGMSTDSEGRFSITTHDTSLKVLQIQQLGYFPQNVRIKPGAFNDIRVMLREENVQLGTVTVKADNSKAKRLLAEIDSRRERNNPESREAYNCDVYSKIELDLTHPREQLRGKAVNKQWKFIFKYIDTSDVSGVPYVPIMLNESTSRRYHTRLADREVITASRMSGAENYETLLTQFTGSIHLKNNFYDQFIQAFFVDIPSPINSNGLLFYDYYIVDSLKVDGRKTLVVHFRPKPAISTPAFKGEMQVDAEEFALRRVKARLAKGQNFNWVRDMLLESSYQRLPEGTWFYKSDRFYADFSITQRDSSKMISFLGNRTLEFSNPVFEKGETDYSTTVSTVEENASLKDESYWSEARPYPISSKEEKVYEMVSRVQETPLYNTLYDIVAMVINGYYDLTYVGFGPVLKFISFNPLEGFRMHFGVRTTNRLDPRNRYMAYAAFGCKDLQVKGGVEWEHLFRKEPTSKLTLNLHYDVVQLGGSKNKYNQNNILSSVLGGGTRGKLCSELVLDTKYEHEFYGGLNGTFNAGYRELYPTAYVPMITPQYESIRSIPSAHAGAIIRFSKDETVIRGQYNKTYADSRYPVVSIGMSGGVAGLNRSGVAIGAGALGTENHPYFIPEVNLDWKVNIAPIGRSMINLNAGTIVGRVPYTHLHLHEGNGSFMLDKTAFSTMDYFEFASDTWVTLKWDHNFNGFFLGKIPWVKKLQLREAFVFKATWGALSNKNNGVISGRGMLFDGPQAPLLFPEGMHTMGAVPYIETGFAITNIFRLLRVDFLWRVTHRDDQRVKPRNFVVNLGIELKF